LAVGTIAVLVVALLVGVALILSGGAAPKKGASHSSSTTTTAKASSTSTSTTQARAVGIGLQSVTWTNTGFAVNPEPGGSARPRTLVTQIWYPSIGGSATTPTSGQRPDYKGGPFPVIVFAHGFDTLPSTYTPLLASLVRAGFVVVAPIFPDENANVINSLTTLAESQIAESDIVNEPNDLAFVVGKVEAGASGVASSHATFLKGLAEPGKVALVGHSDGAQAVAALVYSANYTSIYDAMSVHPFGVVILSGSELSGTYKPPASPPPLLFVQSAVDDCNLPQDAGKLFHDAGGGFFLKLSGAQHFAPYIGQGPAAPIAERVTAAFLKAALAGTPTASELATTVLSSSLATLYPPATAPALIALPVPTQTQLVSDCAVPNSQP
jgi:dienelactone hydrolase